MIQLSLEFIATGLVLIIVTYGIILFSKNEARKDFDYPFPIIKTDQGLFVAIGREKAFEMIRLNICSCILPSHLMSASNMLYQFKMKYGECEMYRELNTLLYEKHVIVFGL